MLDPGDGVCWLAQTKGLTHLQNGSHGIPAATLSSHGVAALSPMHQAESASGEAQEKNSLALAVTGPCLWHKVHCNNTVAHFVQLEALLEQLEHLVVTTSAGQWRANCTAKENAQPGLATGLLLECYLSGAQHARARAHIHIPPPSPTHTHTHTQTYTQRRAYKHTWTHRHLPA
eukprot:1161904-Pelagomonas_calceolata.AAC.3